MSRDLVMVGAQVTEENVWPLLEELGWSFPEHVRARMAAGVLGERVWLRGADVVWELRIAEQRAGGSWLEAVVSVLRPSAIAWDGWLADRLGSVRCVEEADRPSMRPAIDFRYRPAGDAVERREPGARRSMFGVERRLIATT